jgi:low temperature requirement protein LtrA
VARTASNLSVVTVSGGQPRRETGPLAAARQIGPREVHVGVEDVAMTSGAVPRRRTVKHGMRVWYGDGPRRHGEPLSGRVVSYIELFYDLVFVVLVGQAAHALAAHPGWRGAAEFEAVFGLIWIAWINGTLYHELHGREDGRSRIYIFAQMCVLAVLAVFAGHAGTVDGTPFAITYAVLLVLLSWQWYEVRRRDLPQHRSASSPYLVGLFVTILVMLATAWLSEVAQVAVWWCVVIGWVTLGAYGFVSRDRSLQFFQATDSLIERLALFVIIVLGETVVGVVNGITVAGQDPLRITTGVLGLCIGFGVWWNYFDIVGVREPREERGRAATWFFGHLVQCAAIATAGAAMVGLVSDAHSSQTPAAVAWTLGGAVAVSLLLVAVQSATVQRDEQELGSRPVALVLGTGAALVLVASALAPPPWLLALLVIGVLSATWLMAYVPPDRAARPVGR